MKHFLAKKKKKIEKKKENDTSLLEKPVLVVD